MISTEHSVIYNNVNSIISYIIKVVLLTFDAQMSDSILASLERLVVVLFNNFTMLNKGAKFLCCKALVRVLLNLSSKGAVLRSFLSEIGMY